MSDDWKGEAFIRRKPTDAERMRTTLSASSSISHERRRQAGENVSQSAEPWARMLRREFVTRGSKKRLPPDE